MRVRTISIGFFFLVSGKIFRVADAAAGVKWHYCRWGSAPVDSGHSVLLFCLQAALVYLRYTSRETGSRERCTPSCTPSGLVAVAAHPLGFGGPAHQGVRRMYQTSRQAPSHQPRDALLVFRADVKGQRRCKEGCKVCSQLARLLLSLQAPVGRWMARSLGHQALVKVSFSVLLNMFFGINLNVYKMQATHSLRRELPRGEMH